jgi:hypothetical protein
MRGWGFVGRCLFFALPACITPPAAAPVVSGDRLILWDGESIEVTEGTRPGGWAGCNEKDTCGSSVERAPGTGTQGSTGLRFPGHGSGWIGMGWYWSGLLARSGADLQKYGTVTFSMRVDAKSPDQSLLAARTWVALAGGPERHSRSVLVANCVPDFNDGRWHKVAVPMGELYRPGDPAFDPRQVFALWVSSSGPNVRDFDVYLDDIAFERLDQETAATLCRPPKIDYDALPNLPQYPCEESTGAVAGGTGHSLETAIGDIMPVLRYCYDKRTLVLPRLGGRVTAKLRVDPDGSVSEAAAVCTSMPDELVVQCVVSALKGLRLPASAIPSSFQYSITFRPPD